MMNNCFKRAGLLPMLFICLFSSSVGIAQNLKAQQRTNPVAETTRPTQNLTPQQSTSAGNPHASDNVNSPFDAVKGKKEDQKKRDAYSKHYINEDGSFTALIGAGPIHYEKNGKFHDIEHKITPSLDSNFPYANTTNLFESYFGATSHTGVKNKTAEGEIREFLNTQMYWEVNGQAVNTVNSANKAIRIDGDKAYYDNIYENISAEFITLTGKRKLNYIIPNQQALGAVPAGADYLVFTEDVVLPFNWISSITENGVLIKDQLGKEIYLYENPVSTDAAQDELEGQGNTIFETSQMGNTLTIKTKVKTDWLLNNERVFPVLVDPTTEVRPNDAANWTRSVYSNGTHASIFRIGLWSDGRWVRGFAKFNTSSITEPNIQVNSAVGYVYRNYVGGYNNGNWQWTNSSDPTMYSGTTLYNSVTLGYSNVVSMGSTNGWKSSTFYNPEGNEYIKNSINSGLISVGLNSNGTYDYGQFYNLDDHTSSNRPYLVINWEPISTDRTLTVSEAYTGASYANGNHTIANNTNVTATSGTRSGYNIVGWAGTGSVPATGTGGTASFVMTQNSTITWNWQQLQSTDVLFHNYGGTEQLTFDNSRIDTTTPVFRLSHQSEEGNEYEIEINSNPNFPAGTSWTQPFTGTYPVNTQVNFTFNNSFSPTANTTYYVRARAKTSLNNVWSAWSTKLHSFTYQNPQDIPDWFQTTQAQFQTDAYSGLTANASHDVETNPAVNMIQNGTFTNTSGWATHKTWNGLVIEVSSTDCVNCPVGTTRNLKFSDWAESDTGDFMVVSQQVDLTNVDEITYNANSYYNSGSYPPTSRISSLRLIIGGSSTDEEGTTLHTTQQAFTSGGFQSATSSDPNITINTTGYTGIHTVKFVVSFTSAGYQRTALINFYVNNVIANSSSSGTITSTPIHFASVQDATGYDTFKWNQTPGTGDLKFDIQGSSDGVTFSNITGYTDIEETTTGTHTFDISDIDPVTYPHLRLVGKLNGEGVTLHDWSVQFEADCPNSSTWNGTAWSPGVPSDSHTKIIFAGDYNETEDLVGCSVEVKEDADVVIASGHSVTIDNKILVADTGSFTLENNASLVQINPDAFNLGNITVKRNTTEMVKFDATYWSSPVAGQNLKGFSSGTLNNRFYIYNGFNAAVAGDSRHFKAVFVNDANYPMPDEIPAVWEVPVGEITGNLFNMNTYTFKPGWGYSIRVPNNWPHAIGSAGASWEKTFTGEPHNGDIVVPAFGKYTMVGNPYPSAISTLGTEGFFEENPNVQTLHFWTHHFDVTNLPNYNNNYVTYTEAGAAGIHPGGGTPPNGKIEIGQGFVVEHLSIADTESQTRWDVVFKNTMRTTERGVFLKQAVNEIERNRYWLSLSDESETKIAQILIGYMTGATYEFDHQIDGRRMGGAPLYSWIGEEKFTVQGRTLPFEVEDVVPLGFTAPEFGKFKIGLDDFDGFFTDENLQIYIRDNFMQVEHDLRLADYWFSSEEGNFPTRFEIIYKIEEVMGTQDMNDGFVKIYKNKENIVIESEKEKILSVEVYDLSGRTIHRNNKVNAHIYQVRKTSLATQILVVKVLTEKGDIVTKKVINQ